MTKEDWPQWIPGPAAPHCTGSPDPPSPSDFWNVNVHKTFIFVLISYQLLSLSVIPQFTYRLYILTMKSRVNLLIARHRFWYPKSFQFLPHLSNNFSKRRDRTIIYELTPWSQPPCWLWLCLCTDASSRETSGRSGSGQTASSRHRKSSAAGQLLSGAENMDKKQFTA